MSPTPLPGDTAPASSSVSTSVSRRTPPLRSSVVLRGRSAAEWSARRGRVDRDHAPSLLLADVHDAAGTALARVWQPRTDVDVTPSPGPRAVLFVALTGTLEVVSSSDPPLRLEEGNAAVVDGRVPLRLLSDVPTARLEIDVDTAATVRPGRLADGPALIALVAGAQRLLDDVARGSEPSDTAVAVVRLLLDALVDEDGGSRLDR